MKIEKTSVDGKKDSIEVNPKIDDMKEKVQIPFQVLG